jgi:hypothetical protein
VVQRAAVAIASAAEICRDPAAGAEVGVVGPSPLPAAGSTAAVRIPPAAAAHRALVAECVVAAAVVAAADGADEPR